MEINRTPVNIEDEMKRSYVDYAMSVIIGRALPDVRDGLKPVHRRILTGMRDMGLGSTRSYRKCAKIVGEVMGNYHPHGDSPIYDALVRMAQDFSYRYPLVDGQGNFGSVDGDPPAAIVTQTARMSARRIPARRHRHGNCRLRSQLRRGTRRAVLPASNVPNLLVNGSGGIAVGMATNMPPHNLDEIVEAVIQLINDLHNRPPRVVAEHKLKELSACTRPRLSNRRIYFWTAWHSRGIRQTGGVPSRCGLAP